MKTKTILDIHWNKFIFDPKTTNLDDGLCTITGNLDISFDSVDGNFGRLNKDVDNL